MWITFAIKFHRHKILGLEFRVRERDLKSLFLFLLVFPFFLINLDQALSEQMDGA